ncbi:MAG: glutathione S-transferase C-terminal domain-containing protein, partial [Pseudomonadota bacterium]
VAHRTAGMVVLADLEERLGRSRYLFGDRLSLPDIAIAPFVRQFANTDADWFAQQPVPALQRWLSGILESDLFQSCMKKYKPWKVTGEAVAFPETPV